MGIGRETVVRAPLGPSGSGSTPRGKRRYAQVLVAIAVLGSVLIANWVSSQPVCGQRDPCDLRQGPRQDGIRLEWRRPTDLTGFDHYEVWRRTESQSRRRLLDRMRDANTTTYVDRQADVGVNYNYEIWNVNRKGRLLGVSNVLTARIDPNQPVPTTSAPPAATSAPAPTTTAAPPASDPSQGPPEASGSIDRVITGSMPGGFTVPSGQRWRIDGLVETNANVVVEGTLVMRPGATLRFTGINESAFVGGGMDPIPSDVGLWVMGNGVLDARGTAKTGWLRAAQDVPAGATTITLDSAPVGWQAGDEILIVPSASGDFDGFEVRPLESVSGSTISLGAPLSRAHPMAPGGLGLGAEVANLTRDVNIEGTPSGRTHVFVHSTVPQTIQYVGIRYVGPRNGAGFVLGRYGLHFHHMMDASRGSLVQGTVIRDAATHAYVSHASYGITYRDTVAFDVFKEAYWWDDFNGADPMENSFDIAYEHALAARVQGFGSEDSRLAGFALLWGNNGVNQPSNSVRDSVAVGVVGGSKNSSGFKWPGSVGIWQYTDNVAHNNEQLGIFTWDNSSDAFGHDIVRYRAYNNGEAGILHGAYRNAYNYQDIQLIGPSRVGVMMLANPSDQRDVVWRNVYIEGAGRGIEFREHGLAAQGVGQLVNWTMVGVAQPIVFAEATSNSEGGRFDLRGWSVNGHAPSCADVRIESIHPQTIVRAFDGAGNLLFTVTASGCR